MNRLKEYRTRAGLLQSFVAEKLGITQPTVVAHEQGACGVTFRHLAKYAYLYGCEMKDLLGLEASELEALKRDEQAVADHGDEATRGVVPA